MRALAWCLVCLLGWGLAPADVPAANVTRGDQARPRRIVSLVPAVTEMLFAIGAGDQVVGVSSFDRYPPAALERPRLGALVDPDVERLLSLSPDLAVVYETQGDLRARLERAGVPMFDYEHAELADIAITLRRLGERIGRADEAAREAARIEQAIGEIRSRVAGRPRHRTAVVIGREPGGLRGMYASGGVGFIHDMLEVAGGANVFADIRRQNLQVSAEVLLARAPDVILETYPPEGWTAERVERERQLWRVFPSLPAVRNNRIHILADEVLLVPGPRVAEGIRLMAEALHPEAFRAAQALTPTNSTGIRLGISFFSNASSRNRSSAARPRSP